MAAVAGRERSHSWFGYQYQIGDRNSRRSAPGKRSMGIIDGLAGRVRSHTISGHHQLNGDRSWN
jgi:hypothetical protein